MTLPPEADHKAAVKEFRVWATDEETNRVRLLLLRNAIHAYEENHGYNPGPSTTVAGCLQVEMFCLL